MRVVFRVEGEARIGLGHMMRCMALAQSLVDSGHEVFFCMTQQSQHFCQNREDWLGEILLLPDIDKSSEPQWLCHQCIELSADWLVLDGYQFEQTYRKALQHNSFKLAVFDDMNNSGALYADMVINGALNAGLQHYQHTAPKAVLAIGQNYRVLRQEFLQLENNNWAERRSLTIMFGGSDPKNLTIKVLQSLLKLNASMPITIITGSAYSGLDALANLIKNCGLDITHLHDCQNMAVVLVNSKLALSAAGGSQFELLACATPAILVVVADNQKNACQDATKQGWCRVVNSDESHPDEWVLQCLSLWQQTESLHSMHQHARSNQTVDGAKNIVQLMSEHAYTNEHVL